MENALLAQAIFVGAVFSIKDSL